MKIAISAESTIDIQKDLLDEYRIATVPFSVLLGEKNGFDGEVTPDQIFDYVELNKVLPKTGAVNEFQFTEHFEKLLKEYDYVIHFSLSSELSSAYNNAVRAASNIKNVYVIDTRTLSTGIALLAIYARQLADQGLEPDSIINKVKARIPALQVSFVINTMEYLYRGGRCSALVSFGANLLKLKPMILVKNGKMGPGQKYRGKNSIVIGEYCEDILKEFKNPDLSVGFVTSTHASPEMIEVAKKAMEKRGFKKIYVTTAGATVSSHCGPKCLGILFLNDGGK